MAIELHQLTAAIYLVASLAALLGLALPRVRLGRAARWLLVTGAVAHGLAFSQLHRLSPPPSLTDLPAALSLVAWLAVVFSLLLLRRRLEGLAVGVAPLAFVAAFVASRRLASGHYTAGVDSGSWPHLHIILAGAGLALLGLAGIAGLLFLLEERLLKRKRRIAWGPRLPSLEALDRINRVALAVGFPLLTCGLITGLLWTQGSTGQLWVGGAHAVWSVVGWAIYLGLAVARFGIGWRGREAAASAALGFVFLLFAVIGVRVAS